MRGGTLFLRLLQYRDKEPALASAIEERRLGNRVDSVIYEVEPEKFRVIPMAPFAYWASEAVRRKFVEFEPFESPALGRTTRCGLGTLDDFRFLRLRWEVHPTRLGQQWVPYFHGGVYGPIRDEFPFVVRWTASGYEIKAYVQQKVGSASRKVQGEDHYFSPGFVFPRRTRGFSPKAMPSGGIYSTAGQAGFLLKDDLAWGIGLLSSSCATS